MADTTSVSGNLVGENIKKNQLTRSAFFVCFAGNSKMDIKSFSFIFMSHLGTGEIAIIISPCDEENLSVRDSDSYVL